MCIHNMYIIQSFATFASILKPQTYNSLRVIEINIKYNFHNLIKLNAVLNLK